MLYIYQYIAIAVDTGFPTLRILTQWRLQVVLYSPPALILYYRHIDLTQYSKYLSTTITHPSIGLVNPFAMRPVMENVYDNAN